MASSSGATWCSTVQLPTRHRLEVLDKYQRLKKGRLAEAKGPAPKKNAEVVQATCSGRCRTVRWGPWDVAHDASQFRFGESMEEALECEAKSSAPSKAMRKRMGELGLVAMVQGPGPHLKIPSSLCGGVVKPEEFTYFHEMVVQEERCRTMKYGSDWMKNEVVPPIIMGDQTVDARMQESAMAVLSITEAFAGSDVAGLRTTAVLDASGENYIVNGTKKWITGGMHLGHEDLHGALGTSGRALSCHRNSVRLTTTDPCSLMQTTHKMCPSQWHAMVVQAHPHRFTSPASRYADWFVTAVRTGKPGAGGISMMLIPRSDAVQTKIMKSKYSSAVPGLEEATPVICEVIGVAFSVAAMYHGERLVVSALADWFGA
eukprot:Skav229165  [mRNA]  locus=scaffold1381:290530:298177:+ [translate_table: standard]